MATKNLVTAGQRIFRDSLLSPAQGTSVWERYSTLPYLCDPRTGILVRQDFDQVTIASNTIPGWTFTNATAGAITADTTNPNGIMLISAGAATANQGVNWQLNAPVLKLHATKPTIYEARCKFTGLTNLRVQAYIGVSEIDTTVIGSGAITNTSGIGLYGVTTTGVLGAITRATTSTTETGLTLVNNTWFTYAFIATTAKVYHYVNGTLVSSSTTTIPTVALSPTFVCQANGTDTPVMNVDYVAYAGPRA